MSIHWRRIKFRDFMIHLNLDQREIDRRENTFHQKLLISYFKLHIEHSPPYRVHAMHKANLNKFKSVKSYQQHLFFFFDHKHIILLNFTLVLD